MKESIISFETAKLAKEKKFNIPCENFYIEYIDDDVADLFNYEEQRGSGYAELYRNNQEFKYSAPTQSLLQKWLREIHHIHITIEMVSIVSETYCYIIRGNFPLINSYKDLDYEDTYESALEDALEKALNLIYK